MRDRAQGGRDGDKSQTIGQERSSPDDARRSDDSRKGTARDGKDHAHQQGQNDQTVGQGRSDRDDARRSKERSSDKGKADSQQARKPLRQNQSGSGTQDERAQDRNSNSGTGQNVTQGGANAEQGQRTAGQTQSGTKLSAQQQTTLQQSVLRADNAPRVNENSINFQIHTGVAVPSRVSVVSVSSYPALIDVFPDYRDYNFFIVEDEVVFVDHDRHVVDVVPVGPRTRFSGGDRSGSASVTAVELPPDDIRVVQHVLIDRGLLHGEADGVLGPQTREAITVFQRQQGIQMTGSIDARTVSSLGVSDRLSQQASQSIRQSQSSTTGTSTTGSETTGPGQAQTGEPQQNATGQAPSQNTGQAANPSAQRNQSSSTGRMAPNEPRTTGQAAPQTQSGQPNPPSGQMQGTGSSPSQPAQNSGPSK